MNPNPTCGQKCVFYHQTPASRTAVYYPPMYDKEGNNLNPDGNITTGTIRCGVCSKEWLYATQYGETVYEEKKAIDGN